MNPGELQEREGVVFDRTQAVTTKQAFGRLLEYSATTPTGVTVGKVWKARRRDGWVLGSYEECDPPEDRFVLTCYRPLDVVEGA